MRRLAILLPLLAVSGATAEPKIDFTSVKLDNGLQVYVIEDHRAPIVDEIMWVRTGSKDETSGHTGFAHLFEHLMFKGSAHLPDGLMDQLLESAGGWSNAFTTGDMTVFQNTASSNFVEQMLWIDADRLAGLTDSLDQAKLDNQRDVVLNERRQSYENQPYGAAELLLHDSLWPKDHGYHWDTIGYPKDIKAASLADVSAFFHAYYVPNNITMVIAGDVKPADVKKMVDKYFAWIPRGDDPKRPKYATPAPIAKQIDVATTDDVQVPRVYLAWRAPAAFSADEPALELAASILGEGKSSRLYKRLVYSETIAQDVSASHVGEDIGGTFEIVVTAKPGVDPKKLVAEITDEVGKLAAAPPDAAELERGVDAHEAAFLDNLEPLMQRAIQLAEYDVMAHDGDYFTKDLARHRAVTAAQIQSAVATYLKPTARVVLTISPGKKVSR